MGNMMSYNKTPQDLAIEAMYTYHADCGMRLYNDQYNGMYMGVPSSCFTDVVLVPLATWILLIALLLVFVPVLLLAMRRHKAAINANGVAPPKTSLQRYRFSSHAAPTSSTDSEELAAEKPFAQDVGSHFTTKAPVLWTVLSVIYQLLVVAALLMNILEIVRLALANRGVGLLPFTLAGIILVGLISHVRYSAWVRPITNGIVLLFWTFSLVFTAVQLRVLAVLQPVEPRNNTEYLSSDQQIDVGVIVGLYAIFWLVEAARLPMSIREARLSRASA